MSALRRRWKLMLIAAALTSGAAVAFLSPVATLVVGCILGIAAGLILEYADRTVKNSETVRKDLGLKVLGSLPRFVASAANGGRERQLLAGLAHEHPAVQAFQSLCRSLDAGAGRMSCQVIMVTSCIPGEGKSTVSGNLAAILGLNGARVLLVGCDLRRPTLGEMFDQTEEPGLAELLMHGDQRALRKLTVPPIDLVPGGGVPQYPTELINSKPMRDFLEYARQHYDVVVLDAPPVLPVTDAQLLAPVADLLLAVVEPCRTPLRMLRQLVETLQAVGEKVDGVVLNDRSGLAAKYYGEQGRQPMPSVDPYKVPGRVVSQAWGERLVGAVVLAALAIGGFSWLTLHNAHDGTSARPVTDAPRIPAAQSTPPPAHPLEELRTPAVSEQVETVNRAVLATAEGGRAESTLPPTLVTSTPAVPTLVSRPTASGRAAAVPEPLAIAVPPAGAPGAVVNDLQLALSALAEEWRKPVAAVVFGSDSPEEWFAGMGLMASPLGDDLSTLLQLNTPLLLECRQEGGGTVWVAVTGRKGFSWRIRPPIRQGEFLSEADLKRLWTGHGYLPWQDPLHLAGLDAKAPDQERVVRLQQLLIKAAQLGQHQAGVYDRETIKAIGRLQAATGLPVNGRLTPETLILLYQAEPGFPFPKFTLWP